MGLRSAQLGELYAVGARDAARAEAFAQRFGAGVSGTTAQVLAREDVDAVYIGTVHTTHAELTRAALDAGKAVLCEKPLTLAAADAQELVDHAHRVGRPLLEAFKYRFGPMAAALRDTVASGEIGEVTAMRAGFGFPAPVREGRLFDPAVAGGAIYDAGCYPASLAVGVAAWSGQDLGSLRLVGVRGAVGETGVDEWAEAQVQFGTMTGEIATAIVRIVPRDCVLIGTSGRIEIANVWGSRTESEAGFEVVTADGSRRVEVPVAQPMAAEADAVALALLKGRCEVPEMPWEQSVATARLVDEWREGVFALG